MKLKSCFVIMTYDVILAPNLGIKERNKKIKKRKNREIESRKPSPALLVLTTTENPISESKLIIRYIRDPVIC